MGERPVLTDAQQRAGVARIGENIALRSGAGCGKTLVLARRYVELLRAGRDADSPVRRTVALTFTDKAAMEMARRVRRMLRELARTADQDERAKLMAWLDELPEARISTIHSFCASLLRSHAVEAGIDPNFTVCADTLLTDRLLLEAADEALLAAVEAENQGAVTLIGQFSYDRLVEMLRQLVALRGACDLSDYLDPAETYRRWERQLAAQCRLAWERLAEDLSLAELIGEVEAAPCSNPGDELALFRGQILEAVRSLREDPAAMTAATFEKLDVKLGRAGTKAAWGGSRAATDMRHRLKALIDQARQYAVFAESLGEADVRAGEALATLARLAGQADRLYAAGKRARGLLDFDDLINHAHRLVRGNEHVRRALTDQIDQMLIDECQDTDSVQISLLTRLLGADPPAAPPDGRLFVVGDAKQSIYRFRGAQVEVFEELCDRIGEARWEQLSVSFRTHEFGVAFVNHVFAPLMGDDYAPIEAHRKVSPPHPSVEILLADLSDGGVRTAADADEAQADLLAERIEQMIRRPQKLVRDPDTASWRAARPGDIAVLFARMTHSLKYERRLQARGIPYYVVGGVGFFRQQEVYDLLNALRAIDNPFADIAFFGALRSSLFGLDDNALMQIAETVDRPYLPSLQAAPGALRETLPEHEFEALRHACDLLMRLGARKDAVGVDQLLRELLDATGYEAAALSAFQGQRVLGNVRQLVDLAREASAEGVSLADFLSEIEELVIKGARYEQAAVAGEAEDVVRIMTIHKAKGLEFPVVFIPDLNAGRAAPASPILHRLDWGLAVRLVGEAEGDQPAGEPLSYRVGRLLESTARRQEDLRKFYVGATRHQDHLVFVGADWRTRDGQFRNRNSFLAQLDEVLGVAEALDAGRETVPYGGGLTAAVRRIGIARTRHGRGGARRGRRMLSAAANGEQLGKNIIAAAPKTGHLPLLGPLPVEAHSVELGVTALSEFEHCPALYQWRYELRAPEAARTADKKEQSKGRGSALDAATVGTLYHRCMEQLDFAAPQAARSLVQRAAGQMGLAETADVDALSEQLEAMLAEFRSQPLWPELTGARRLYPELDFMLTVGPARLRGQIDLLYEAADGAWHIVDYKSDHVAPGEVAERARRYELQMLVYAMAAERHLANCFPSAGLAGATLCFLRAAAVYRIEFDASVRARIADRVAALAKELIAARRIGRFEPRKGPACKRCPRRVLC